MIAATLEVLDNWYNEPASQTGDRPLLLSKLALLELCGWLEGEFDRLIMTAEAGRIKNRSWLTKDVVERTSGFKFSHLRKMFSEVFGEMYVQRIEDQMEAQYPGELDRFQTLLGQLWKKRCSFAHADFAANLAAQQAFDAPSLARAQLTVVEDLVAKFEASMNIALANI